MVLYFTSNVVEPPATLYMGRDKHENEDLIRFGWDQDVWFHVSNLSSAHVYLRLQPGQDWTQIDEQLLQDCAQLVKANSIEGNKRDNISIVYTPWSNLKKTKGMETGQVGFQSETMVHLQVALVRKVSVKTRVNAIVNRLNKTKLEKNVSAQQLEREKIDQERLKRNQRVGAEKRRRNEALAEQQARRQAEQEHDYKHVLKEEHMVANTDKVQQYVDDATGQVDVNAFEEDFM